MIEFKHLNSLPSGSCISIGFAILNLVYVLPHVWFQLSKSEARGEPKIFSKRGQSGIYQVVEKIPKILGRGRKLYIYIYILGK